MTKRKLKPFVIPTIYVLSIITFVTSVYFIQRIKTIYNYSHKKHLKIIVNKKYIPTIL